MTVSFFDLKTPQERVAHVREQAEQLCRVAGFLGVSLRIDRVALTPLAMGHAEHVVEAWPARHQPPA